MQLGVRCTNPGEQTEVIDRLRGVERLRGAQVDLRVNGMIVAHGSLDECVFVDGGVMFKLVDPPAERPAPTRMPAPGQERKPG